MKLITFLEDMNQTCHQDSCQAPAIGKIDEIYYCERHVALSINRLDAWE